MKRERARSSSGDLIFLNSGPDAKCVRSFFVKTNKIFILLLKSVPKFVIIIMIEI